MTPEDKQDRKKLAIGTAYVVAALAGVFVLCITTLLVATWIQLTVNDPLDSPALLALKESYGKGGDTDPAILDGIRALDLQARRAYFTNQAQMRLGSYLAFGGVLVLLLALKCAGALSPRVPMPSKCPGGDQAWHDARWARRAIGVGGFACLVAVVAVAYLTDHMHFSMARVSDTSPPPIAEPDNGGEALPQPVPDGTPAAHQPPEGHVADQPDTPAEALPDFGVTDPAPPVVPPAPTYWPCFRGPNGLGIADVKAPPTSWDGKSGSNVLCKVKVPRSGFSSPVVWSNRLFVTGADTTAREIFCFDTDTGDIAWQAQVETVIEGEFPEVSEDTGFAAPTMATDGERVYAIFGTGDIAAYTMAGKRVWARSLGVPENHYGHSSSLMVYGSRVIVQYDHGKSASILALEGANGKLAWETKRPVKIAWTSPVLAARDGRDELILSAEPFVISYDPATGKELWKVSCMSGEVGPSPAFADGYVFVANEYAKLVALDPGEQQILWENEDDLPDTASPLAVGNMLFTSGSAGMITCYNAESGEIHWKHELDDSFYASPIFAGGMVYQMDNKGVMHIFKADTTYESVAAPKLGEDSVCTAAFVGNRIYLRGMNHLYCIAEPAKK